MKLNQPVTQLDCGGCGPYRGYGGGGGGRSPEPVEWKVLPVRPSLTGFVLPSALAQARLLVEQPGKSLADLAAEKWGGSTGRLFADLEKRGITASSVQARLLDGKRVMIGWSYEPQNQQNGPEVKVCGNLEITLAVLSRCVNQIYFQNREPDFSWNTLFGQSLVVDEDLRGWFAAA